MKPYMLIAVLTLACFIFYNDVCADESESSVECGDGEIRCLDNSRCYPETDRCNGFPVCDDRSDEADCAPATCESGYFRCGDGQCIPNSYVCDGSPDCSDDSDEASCNELCDASEFMCVSDKICINKLLTCDGKSQCSDSSDEEQCANVSRSEHVAAVASGRSSCDAEVAFDCLGDSSECIPTEKKCNGIPDCSNGADENEQICPATGHYSCDEVSEWCSQLCVDNKEHGYECRCREGYIVSPDEKHTCVVAEGSESVWVTDGNIIHQFGTQSNGEHSSNMLEIGQPIDALDFDFVANKIYWINSLNRTIYRMTTDGSNLEALTSVDVRPVAIAYDWIHGTLYLSSASRIEVVTVSRKLRAVLLAEPEVKDVSAIAVDPRTNQGYVYWGQGGHEAGIYRAGLDGSLIESIAAEEKHEHPSAMTMDFSSGDGKLLWLDSHRHHIMSWDVTTHETKLWFSITGHTNHLTGLAVSTELVYWIERASGTVYTADKYSIRSGLEQTAHSYLPDLNIPKNVIVHHRHRQPSGDNVCASNNGGCSHICLPTSRDGVARPRCFCPSNDAVHSYTMNSDNSTCTERMKLTRSESDVGKQPEAVKSLTQPPAQRNVDASSDKTKPLVRSDTVAAKSGVCGLDCGQNGIILVFIVAGAIMEWWHA